MLRAGRVVALALDKEPTVVWTGTPEAPEEALLDILAPPAEPLHNDPVPVAAEEEDEEEEVESNGSASDGSAQQPNRDPEPEARQTEFCILSSKKKQSVFLSELIVFCVAMEISVSRLLMELIKDEAKPFPPTCSEYCVQFGSFKHGFQKMDGKNSSRIWSKKSPRKEGRFSLNLVVSDPLVLKIGVLGL